VMTTKRFFNENVKLITRSKKVKNWLIINNSLMKNVASSTYAMSRIFEILTHKMCVIDVQTNNQQKIIRRIEKQNEILHSSLRIARIIWSKSVINEEKELSLLIVKIHSAEQINRLIKDDFLHEYSQIFCELFVNNCRIKQCFNCQRYDHIDKICRYERRCLLVEMMWIELTSIHSNSDWCELYCEFSKVQFNSFFSNYRDFFMISHQTHVKKVIYLANYFVKRRDI
jgi:hypothetical protein